MRRRWVAPLWLLGIAASPPAAVAQSEQSADAWWRGYAAHRQSVAIGPGRTLNLYCAGTGRVTVLLESGMGDGIQSWRRVQHDVAARARVCAYDRAGLGESSADPGPRSARRIAQDLEAMVRVAGLRPPFVVVGHSLGGQTIRLFAARNRKKVAGMVLVDPGGGDMIEAVRRSVPEALALDEKEFEPIRICAHDPRPAEAVERCRRRAWRDLPPDLAATFRPKDGPDHYRTFLAEDDAFENRNEAELRRAGRDLGAIPLLVLIGRPELPEGLTPTQREKVWAILTEHKRAVARYSRRGEARMVEGAGHYIQFDRPEVVTRAILEMVDKASIRPRP